MGVNLFKELDRYYIQTLAIIEQKEDYSPDTYKITKMFYDGKIKSLRGEIKRTIGGIEKLIVYDLERSFVSECNRANELEGT